MPWRRVRGLYIDESNHSRNPEVVTGIFSPYPEDAFAVVKKIRDEETGGITFVPGLEKQRRKFAMPGDLNNRKVRYILFSGADTERVFGADYRRVTHLDEKIKIIAFTELIRFFEPLDILIIDGILRESVLDTIEQLTRYPLPTHCLVKPRADETFPGVNMADHLAYALFRHHTNRRKRKRIEAYEEYILQPHLEDYKELFSKKRKAMIR